jgi:hypothetical protein
VLAALAVQYVLSTADYYNLLTRDP